MFLFFLFSVGAFDFLLLNGTASGIGAGTGVVDWRHALTLNPAQTGLPQKFTGTIAYTRPYGLEGVNCLSADVGFRWSRLNITVGLRSLGAKGYSEYDMGSTLGFDITKDFTGGVGFHTLVRNMLGYGMEAVPAFDLGILLKFSTIRLGIAVQQLNKPRFENKDELLPRFRGGIGWEPVKPMLLGVDFEKQGETERLVSGVEVRIFPELRVRGGFETAPWCWRGGIGINLSWLGLDYGYQYHPEMGDMHIIGLTCSWN